MAGVAAAPQVPEVPGFPCQVWLPTCPAALLLTHSCSWFLVLQSETSALSQWDREGFLGLRV